MKFQRQIRKCSFFQIRNNRLFFYLGLAFEINKSFAIENVVFNELLARGYEVYIGKNKNKEIDLISLLSKTHYGSDGMGGIISNGMMYVGFPR